MKIERLHIKRYRQFQDLELDFTYPKGHRREGQPLDKVCIIGDNGTGKTTLLRIVFTLLMRNSEERRFYLDEATDAQGKNDDYWFVPYRYADGAGPSWRPASTHELEVDEAMEIEAIFWHKGQRYRRHWKVNEGEGGFRADAVSFERLKEGEDSLGQTEEPVNYNDWVAREYPVQTEGPNKNYRPALGLFFPAGLHTLAQQVQRPPKDAIGWQNYRREFFETGERHRKGNARPHHIHSAHVVDLTAATFKQEWPRIFLPIAQYQLTEVNYRLQITEEPEEGFDVSQATEQWREKHENPLRQLAIEFLEIILQRQKMAIRLYASKMEDVTMLRFRQKLSEEVANEHTDILYADEQEGAPAIKQDIDVWDFPSGTAQVVLTAAPLQTFEPQEAIVFIDEPEASLYPPVLESIIANYMQAGASTHDENPGRDLEQEDPENSNQFFFATHSPIIAAQFNSWEIVGLTLTGVDTNQHRNITVQRVSGESMRDPRYLRWDDIYRKLFNTEDEGGPKRKSTLVKAISLRDKIKKMNRDEDYNAWIETLKMYKDAADKIGWDFPEEE